MSRPEPVLIWDNVTVGYSNGLKILEDVSVSVGKGEVVAIIGPNGAGKSTLFKALIGDARVFSGSVRVGETEVTHWPANRLQHVGVGYVPQLGDVIEGLTVMENLEIGGYSLQKAVRNSRIADVMEMFPNLKPLARRPVRKLSGGERKLVGIGRALIPNPTLLALDEPTASLAPAYISEVLDEILPTIVAQGVTIVIIEQRAAEALLHSDWCYVLHEGRNYVDMEATAALDDLVKIGASLLGG